MPIIDLTTHRGRAQAVPAPAEDAVAEAPRRLGLTLPELLEAARLSGGAPLPFDVAPAPTAGAMESRLGDTPASGDDAAFRTVVAKLPDAAESLARRGLVTDAGLEPGAAGALGLLATPEVAIDLDVALPGCRLRAWHRQAGDAVATLATADGIVYELSWYAAAAWPAEIARAVAPPEDVAMGRSEVPAYLDLPMTLAETVTEAVATGRPELIDVLLARGAAVRDADGELGAAAARRAALALCGEARGRLRALVARTPAGSPPRRIGVVSWTLVGDGWRHLRPYRAADGPRLEVGPADPADLAALLAPSLAATR